jgi:hypothetical protein
MTLKLENKVDSSNTLAIYHFWSHPKEPAPYKNLRTPILLSIATLRAVSNVPILVLDVTGSKQDWGDYPEKLKFDVGMCSPSLYRYQKLVDGWLYLSRIFDIRLWPNQTIRTPKHFMYVDCDVFFFRDPFPLTGNTDRFCWDGWNTGFFYYNQHGDYMYDFFEIFESYTKASIWSHEVRKVMKQYIGYDGWYGVWDEMILTYMKNKHPEFFSIIPWEEHTTVKTLHQADPAKVKVFHSNGLMVENPVSKWIGESKHCRGILALVVKEFYDNIIKVLNENDLATIFTEEERSRYNPLRFSLLEQLSLLKATKDSKDNYHLEPFLQGMSHA